MNKINVSYHETEIGEFIIASFGKKICILDFKNRKNRGTIDKRIKRYLKSEFLESENDLIIKTKKQIDEYLMGNRKFFNIPILSLGTEFQQKVWNELLKIPYGKTISYLELANRIGNPKAVRAVALANNANAISLIIPCHRVISSNGKMCGYAGGILVKKKILDIESGRK